MLEKLKAVVWRGKLNCGHCAVSHKLEDGTVKVNRCANGPYCGRWFLHKFRHTYATRHLQDGIDTLAFTALKPRSLQEMVL
jgi:hypothetical protein